MMYMAMSGSELGCHESRTSPRDGTATSPVTAAGAVVFTGVAAIRSVAAPAAVLLSADLTARTA